MLHYIIVIKRCVAAIYYCCEGTRIYDDGRQETQYYYYGPSAARPKLGRPARSITTDGSGSTSCYYYYYMFSEVHVGLEYQLGTVADVYLPCTNRIRRVVIVL